MILLFYVLSTFNYLQMRGKKLQDKATNQKEEKREKPKPGEQEGMPQRQHCPPEKRREDRNPE
jgi:hypothetical protein